MKISVDWTGFEEVKAALDRWGRENIEAIERQLDDCGEDLLSKSQALAPKLTGDLEASGTKDPVQAIPSGMGVQVGFNMGYAARQHEGPGKPGPITRGKPSVDGMQPGRKYLERPLKRYQDQYKQDIADAMREVGGS